MKALIIDDSQFMRAALKKIISSSVDDINEAGDLAEAVEKFRQFQPDIVFLDIMMENTDTGVSILKELRDINAEVKVVIVSSLGIDNTLVQKAFQMGITGYVQKPFKEEHVKKYL